MTEATAAESTRGADVVVGEERPSTCDVLIHNARVLTMDENRTVYATGAVAVTGRTITAVGPDRELLRKFRADRVLNAGGATVHPGLIDAHVHITLHTSRGALTNVFKADDNAITFDDWLAELSGEDEFASAQLGCVEMLRNGFTAFLEPGTAFEPDAVAAAAEAVGVRASLGDPFLWDRAGAGEAGAALLRRVPPNLERAQSLLGRELKRNADPNALVRGHVALYGEATASDELQRAAKACADDQHVVLNQHQSFTPDVAEREERRLGKPQLLHLAELGVLDRNCTFVHMNVIRDEEVRAIVESGLSIVWHPGNYLFYGIAERVRGRMPELHRLGVNLSVGVDVAKAWTFGDMGWLAYVVARETGDAIGAEVVIEMQTINAARAMGLDEMIGSLEPGKRADIVIRSMDAAEGQPDLDVVHQLALISRGRSVDTVFVDGEIVFRKGHSTRLDESAVHAEARSSARRVAGRLGLRPGNSWPIVA